MSTAPMENMAGPFRIGWGQAGSKIFETGTDRGVVYVDGVGYPWVGLVSVNEEPEGGAPKPYYLDGVKYIHSAGLEEFAATIEAYTYPDEFMYCDGTAPMMTGMFITQQPRKPFDFTYRTMVGNDIEGIAHGYKLHLVYNAMATPSSKTYGTLSDSPEPSTFSWSISTKREKFENLEQFGTKFGAHVVVDSRTTYPWAMEALENFLYGRAGAEGSQPHMPTSEELIQLFVDNALLKITDNGDGTWTAEGPDTVVGMLDEDNFIIDWPSVIMLPGSTTEYTVNSL